jgi:hypothetical protein
MTMHQHRIIRAVTRGLMLLLGMAWIAALLAVIAHTSYVGW